MFPSRPRKEGSSQSSPCSSLALTNIIPTVPLPAGWSGVFLSMLSFLFFTDMGIYWIHRGLHHRLFYKV